MANNIFSLLPALNVITIIYNNNCDDDDDDETDYDVDDFKNQKYFLWRRWWWVNLNTGLLEKDHTVIVIACSWSQTMPDNDGHDDGERQS